MVEVGLPGNRRRRPKPEVPTAADLLNREFARRERDHLGVTDITGRPTREGKAYCAVVLDTYSRRVVGWSIDATRTSALVTNALSVAISNRSPRRGTAIHSYQGCIFMPWAFTRRALESGLVPSMGSIGDCNDDAMVESFWGRMQTELLNRRKWHTRPELANAIFEYLEDGSGRRMISSAVHGLRTSAARS